MVGQTVGGKYMGLAWPFVFETGVESNLGKTFLSNPLTMMLTNEYAIATIKTGG